MTLKEAIRIQRDILKHVKPGDPPEEHDALKLSTEVMEWREHMRKYVPPGVYQYLPGESYD